MWAGGGVLTDFRKREDAANSSYSRSLVDSEKCHTHTHKVNPNENTYRSKVTRGSLRTEGKGLNKVENCGRAGAGRCSLGPVEPGPAPPMRSMMILGVSVNTVTFHINIF